MGPSLEWRFTVVLLHCQGHHRRLEFENRLMLAASSIRVNDKDSATPFAHRYLLLLKNIPANNCVSPATWFVFPCHRDPFRHFLVQFQSIPGEKIRHIILFTLFVFGHRVIINMYRCNFSHSASGKTRMGNRVGLK